MVSKTRVLAIALGCVSLGYIPLLLGADAGAASTATPSPSATPDAGVLIVPSGSPPPLSAAPSPQDLAPAVSGSTPMPAAPQDASALSSPSPTAAPAESSSTPARRKGAHSAAEASSLPPLPALPPLPTYPRSESEAPLIPSGIEQLPEPAREQELPSLPPSPAGGTEPQLDLGGPKISQRLSVEELEKVKFPVTKFVLKYGPKEKAAHPALPPVDKLANIQVELGKANDGFVAPGKGTGNVKIRLGDPLPGKPEFYGDALRQVYTAIQKRLNDADIYGVFVLADTDEIDPLTYQDLRPAKDANTRELTVLIYAAEVQEVRTITKRPKFHFGDVVINQPKYKRIITDSPLKPPKGGKRGSLLQKNRLKDYLVRLSRFPGRRVDAAVNASGERGGVVLDYIVREAKDWFAYVQGSNTGTRFSGLWRESVALEYRQLLHLDDIFDVDYTTSDFSRTNAVNASYQLTPLFPDLLKFKVYGSYGSFTADQVGFDLQDFHGQTYTAGGLLTYTPFLVREYPVDFFAGAEWTNVSVTNTTFPQSGSSNFFLPYIGVSTEQKKDRYNVFSSVRLQANAPGIAGTKSGEDLDKLGRLDSNRDFVIGQWNFATSAYLEPLIFGKEWTAGNDWWKSTLAHEVALSFRGQYTFGDRRLIPQFEDTVGGLYTVRGYPESLAAGDDAYIASAEYRLHLPRLLRPWKVNDKDAAKKDQKFVLRPAQVFGLPEWDLVFRAFFDAGFTHNDKIEASSEVDRTLAGAGVGLELQIKNLDVRLDYGIPLISEEELLTQPVKAGDGRLHFSGSLLF